MNAVCFCIALLAARPDIVPEIHELDGTWLMQSWEVNGNVVGLGGNNLPDRIVVRGGIATLYAGDTILVKDLKYVTKQGPKHKEFTVVYVGQDPELKTRYATTIRGIYRVDGDRLTRCYHAGKMEPPAEFKSTAGSECTLQVLLRDKAK